MAEDGPFLTLDLESRLRSEGYTRVAGVDEAGRGCLAGPVVAAAVILPSGASLDGVDDSKKLSAAQREDMALEVKRQAVAVGVGMCSPSEIDRLNILWAAMEAMRRAVHALKPAPDYLLIDGNRCFPDAAWPLQTVIGGDGRHLSIAAASIIAKTTRDALMRDLHLEYPAYGWNTNVGYPTRAHYDALAEHGPTQQHRRSFRLMPDPELPFPDMNPRITSA